MHIYLHIYICIYIYRYIYIQVYIYIYIYICTHILYKQICMHIYIYIYTYTYIFSTCILYTHHIYINLFSRRFAASQFAQVVRNGISLKKTVMLVKTLHTTMTVGLILENPETFFYHRPCRYDFLKYHCKNQIFK